MGLVTDYRTKKEIGVPRLSKWDDFEYQSLKGKKLAEKFRFSIMTGVKLESPPILPGKTIAIPNPSVSLLQRKTNVVPDNNHPFSRAFSDYLMVDMIEDLAEAPYGSVDFLYLTGGNITLEPIKTIDDYDHIEVERQIDGILLPAVRVVFNPQVL